MRIALTGTPGAGKTTLAAVAAASGWRVVDVKQWAQATGAVVGHDEADQADIIDVAKLARLVAAERAPASGHALYEGHLSHLLPMDVAWVVRCDPDVLATRLAARGYSQAKVTENLEAEALDIILQEALEHQPRVVQRDGTRRSPTALFKSFAEATLDSSKGHDLEPVDWSDRLPIRTRGHHGP